MKYSFSIYNLNPQMDYLSEDDILSLMSKMTVKTLLRFIRTSQFHKSLFEHAFIDLCKSLTDDELAWIRSHGDELMKTIATKELLDRHPKLIPLTDETIRIAIELYKENLEECIRLYGPIELWDVYEVTNMSQLFQFMDTFNQPINNWDVSKVTNMKSMFCGALTFNQPIGDWDVSNVTNMNYMFNCANAFNQPIGDWDVSNVTGMYGMFYRASDFNQPICDWNVSKVTNMSDMFHRTNAFNQPIGDWNVSKVTNMYDMFNHATAFNQPIGDWNVSNVTNMWYMFDHCLISEENKPTFQ